MLERIAKLFEEEVAKMEKEAYEKGYKDGMKVFEEDKEVCEGDKVRITDDSESLGFYRKGDILTVDRVLGGVHDEVYKEPAIYVKELEGIPGGNFFIGPKEYEVIKDNPFASPKCTRKAVIGDLIRIEKPYHTASKYAKGDVLEVVNVIDNVVHVRGLYLSSVYDSVPVNIAHDEYVVVGKVFS